MFFYNLLFNSVLAIFFITSYHIKFSVFAMLVLNALFCCSTSYKQVSHGNMSLAGLCSDVCGAFAKLSACVQV